MEIEPQERGTGFIFENRIQGGVIPKEYISSVKAGIQDTLENGPLARYPLIDVKVALVDGSYHTVDSSELAFRSAGAIAMRDGCRKADPVLLEPVMSIEVISPGEFLGDILGDLSARRGQIRNISGESDTQVVKAAIPLAETFDYTTTLRSLTQGRATSTMEFDFYEAVPDSIMRKVIGQVA